MNFLFISPNYPDFFYKFCAALKNRGAQVFGVGDSADILIDLKNSLAEYFVVPKMTDFAALCKVTDFIFNKYGNIDGVNSLNEFWLETEGKLRERYNIDGACGDLMQDYKLKSRMKKRFATANVPAAPYVTSIYKSDILDFAVRQGFPIFCKPDNGVGAQGARKFDDMLQLLSFVDNNNCGDYIFEPYVDGEIYSFDGLCDKDGDIVFYACHHFYTPIDKLKQSGEECVYRTLTDVPIALLDVGRNTVKAFELKSSFFHIEFFKLLSPLNNVANIGDYVALEANMRIAGGYTAEMLYHALGLDIYALWAAVVCGDKPIASNYAVAPIKHAVINVARKNGKNYKYSICQLKDAYPQEFILSALTDKEDNPFGNLEIIAAFTDQQRLDNFVDMAIEKV